MSGRIRVGISGWRYPPWRGRFYPQGLAQRGELAYAARHFGAIEINGSFYSLQHPASYASWYAETPSDFVFAVKGGRFITHLKRLREVVRPLANFFASGIFNLREKLGPILWQFPPNVRFERERLARFFALLPRDTAAAQALARRRDRRLMKGRCRLAIDGHRALRHAVEVRHESFVDPRFVELLCEHEVALVVSESAGSWPLIEDVTSDFLYLRLHGDRELFRAGYGPLALDRWAERLRAWSRGEEPADARKAFPGRLPERRERDIYCFFDNTDDKLRAPVDAASLMRRLALAPPGRSRRRWMAAVLVASTVFMYSYLCVTRTEELSPIRRIASPAPTQSGWTMAGTSRTLRNTSRRGSSPIARAPSSRTTTRRTLVSSSQSILIADAVMGAPTASRERHPS